MSKNTPKKTDTKVKESNFIRFSPVQRDYLNEIIGRHQEKFNRAVGLIYKELGVTERISKAPPGTYVLRQDCSGTDVLLPPAPPKDPPVEDPKDIKPPEKETEPQK